MENKSNSKLWWGFFLVIILLGAGAGSFLYFRTIAYVDDVSRPQTIRFDTLYSGMSVYKYYVTIEGEIDGEAEIHYGAPGHWGRGRVTVRGKFRVDRRGDYYASSCEFKYSPKTVKSGWVRIRCRLR